MIIVTIIACPTKKKEKPARVPQNTVFEDKENSQVSNEILCEILYQFYILKNVRNTHGGGVLLLEKLQASSYHLTKTTLIHGCFSRFLDCTNGTKLRNASLVISIIFRLTNYWNLNLQSFEVMISS